MRKSIIFLLAFTALLSSCNSSDIDNTEEQNTSNNTILAMTVPTEQEAGKDILNHVENSQILSQAIGGVHLKFQMEGITHIELECVDGYAIAGTAKVSTGNGQPQITEVTNGQSIITLKAPDGGTLKPDEDYYITTLPCDLSGGYRLSIYKNGLVAEYYGVYQKVTAGNYISPDDLVENELDFKEPDAPFVEKDRPELDQATKNALVAYHKDPTEENKTTLLQQMGIRYDKVVARKKAKLRELEREARNQSLIDEMQKIVDEMVENREIRLEQQFLRLIDPRIDDNPNDEWMVLRGTSAKNAYIGFAPVTNGEYAVYNKDFSYNSMQGKYPVTNVTFAEATSYCDWLSTQDSKHTYRLPTEEEWILAAGHMPKDVMMNSDYVEKGLTAVDAYAQTTGACGGIDFWGNCWEWTSTQNTMGLYIVKGGSWDSSRDACRSEYSDDARNPLQGYTNVGFRVVRIDR